MTALHQAGRWKDVLAAAEELAQLDPDHPDPGGMVSDARAKLQEARQRMADLLAVELPTDITPTPPEEVPFFQRLNVFQRQTFAQRSCSLWSPPAPSWPSPWLNSSQTSRRQAVVTRGQTSRDSGHLFNRHQVRLEDTLAWIGGGGGVVASHAVV